MKIVRKIYPPISSHPHFDFQPSIHKQKTWCQQRFYKTGTLQIDKSLSNILGPSDKTNTFVERISN